MDRGTIELKYSNAIHQAEALEGLAFSSINSLKNDINLSAQNLSRGWKGEEMDIYNSKINSSEGKIISLRNNLISAASVIRIAAKNIYDAEMEALAIELERAYLEQQKGGKKAQSEH